jgi:HlyD family secretion protein
MRWFKAVRPLLILLAAALIALLIIRSRPEAKPVVVKEKAWPVRVQVAQPGVLSPTLTLYGRIESLWSTQLTSGMTADVAEVSVLEGDEVAKGGLLVGLDDRDARLLLAQRDAELAEAEARIRSEESRHTSNLENLPHEKSLYQLNQDEVERLSNLVKKQMGAQSALDRARQDAMRQAISLRAREQSISEHEATLAELTAKRARAEALRDQARLELERCRVSAPFDGRIARVLVSPGKRVRVGDPLVQLYDTGAMVIRAQLPSRYIGAVRDALRQGKPLEVTGEVDGLPLQARLLRMAGEVNGGSGGVEALFALEQGQRFQQGRFVRMDLTLLAQENLLAVPAEAIYGADRIYRLTDAQRLQPLRVQRIGEQRLSAEETLVLLASGDIRPGDLLVLTQLPNAVEGLLVTPSDVQGNPLVKIQASGAAASHGD